MGQGAGRRNSSAGPSRGRSAIGSGLLASCLLLRQCMLSRVLGAYGRPRLALAAPRRPAYPASVTWPGRRAEVPFVSGPRCAGGSRRGCGGRSASGLDSGPDPAARAVDVSAGRQRRQVGCNRERCSLGRRQSQLNGHGEVAGCLWAGPAGEGRGERQRLLRRREGLERWRGGPPRGSPERLASGRALTIIVLRQVRRVGDRLEGERVLSNELEEPAAQPLALLERLAQLLVFRDHVVPAQTHATDHGHESGGDAAGESGGAAPRRHRRAGGQVCCERADGRVRWLSHTLSSHLGATGLRCDNPRGPWHRTPGSGGTRGKSPVLPSPGSFIQVPASVVDHFLRTASVSYT